jgi:hypothetical protein
MAAPPLRGPGCQRWEGDPAVVQGSAAGWRWGNAGSAVASRMHAKRPSSRLMTGHTPPSHRKASRLGFPPLRWQWSSAQLVITDRRGPVKSSCAIAPRASRKPLKVRAGRGSGAEVFGAKGRQTSPRLLTGLSLCRARRVSHIRDPASSLRLIVSDSIHNRFAETSQPALFNRGHFMDRRVPASPEPARGAPARPASTPPRRPPPGAAPPPYAGQMGSAPWRAGPVPPAGRRRRRD